VPKHQGPGPTQDHGTYKHVDSFIPDALAHPKSRSYSVRLRDIRSTRDEGDEVMVRYLYQQETSDREDRSENSSHGSDTPEDDE
jgi:hypothetical protein